MNSKPTAVKTEKERILGFFNKFLLPTEMKLYFSKSMVKEDILNLAHFQFDYSIHEDTVTGLDVHGIRHTCDGEKCKDDFEKLLDDVMVLLRPEDYALYLLVLSNYFLKALGHDVHHYMCFRIFSRLIPLTAPHIAVSGEDLSQCYLFFYFTFTRTPWYIENNGKFVENVGEFTKEDGYVYLHNHTIVRKRFDLKRKGLINLKEVIEARRMEEFVTVILE